MRLPVSWYLCCHGPDVTRAHEIAYLLASKHAKALKAYEKAHAWRQLFSLALEQKVSQDVLSGLIERVSGTSCLQLTGPFPW